MTSDSIAPNARPSFSSGTARCVSVMKETSPTALPTPTSAIATSATAGSASSATSTNGAPHRSMEPANQAGEPLAPDQRRGDQPAEDAADADGAVEDADPRLPLVGQVERDHDDQHQQRARQHALGGDQRARAR